VAPRDRSEEEEEARRWQKLVDAFLDHLPEVRSALERFSYLVDYEEGRRWGPGDLAPQVSTDLLDFDCYPVGLETDVWRRLLAFLEIVEELRELLERDVGEGHPDAVTVNAFADAGILCSVTSNRDGLQVLLPLMGPKTVESAKAEVTMHRRDEPDWSLAGSEFEPLSTLSAEELRPLDA
jgi:hypothetical protein